MSFKFFNRRYIYTFRHESELIISNYSETLKALHREFSWPFPVSLSSNLYFNPIYRLSNVSFSLFVFKLNFSSVLEDKDSVVSSTDHNGHHSDSGLEPNDRNNDHGT